MEGVFSCVAAAKWECRSTTCRRVTWWCVEGCFGTLSQVDRLCECPQRGWCCDITMGCCSSLTNNCFGPPQGWSETCVSNSCLFAMDLTHTLILGALACCVWWRGSGGICACVLFAHSFVCGCVPSGLRVIADIYMILIVYWALCALKASLDWTFLRDIRC